MIRKIILAMFPSKFQSNIIRIDLQELAISYYLLPFQFL